MTIPIMSSSQTYMHTLHLQLWTIFLISSRVVSIRSMRPRQGLFMCGLLSWGGTPFLFLRIFSVSTHSHSNLTISGVLYWSMPLDNTYVWLRAITPTTALHHYHDKQQNQAYHVSWHRMFLLVLIQASLCLSPSLSLHILDGIRLICRNFQQS